MLRHIFCIKQTLLIELLDWFWMHISNSTKWSTKTPWHFDSVLLSNPLSFPWRVLDHMSPSAILLAILYVSQQRLTRKGLFRLALYLCALDIFEEVRGSAVPIQMRVGGFQHDTFSTRAHHNESWPDANLKSWCLPPHFFWVFHTHICEEVYILILYHMSEFSTHGCTHIRLRILPRYSSTCIHMMMQRVGWRVSQFWHLHHRRRSRKKWCWIQSNHHGFPIYISARPSTGCTASPIWAAASRTQFLLQHYHQLIIWTARHTNILTSHASVALLVRARDCWSLGRQFDSV